MAKQTSILAHSPLTNTVYVVTKYRVTKDLNIEAIEKFDVTRQFIDCVERYNANKEQETESEGEK